MMMKNWSSSTQTCQLECRLARLARELVTGGALVCRVALAVSVPLRRSPGGWLSHAEEKEEGLVGPWGNSEGLVGVWYGSTRVQ